MDAIKRDIETLMAERDELKVENKKMYDEIVSIAEMDGSPLTGEDACDIASWAAWFIKELDNKKIEGQR